MSVFRSKMSFSVTDRYLELVKAKNYQPFQRHLQILKYFQSFDQLLLQTHPAWSSKRKTLTDNNQLASQSSEPTSIYLHGGPGCGKTFICKVLNQHMRIKEKEWWHFNSFMISVHQQLHKLKNHKDQISVFSNSLCRRTRVLFLDQFQVTDISDAMILKRIFERSLLQGLILVATSNRPPQDLYKNGLMRQRFQPFIPFLKANSQTIDMDTTVDFRFLFEKASLKSVYLYPMQKISHVQQIFRHYCGKEDPHSLQIQPYQGRKILISRQANGCAYFTFKELCQSVMGPSDYIGIAKSFNTIVLVGLPQLSQNNRDQTRRFIWLIDQLYDQKVRLYILAQKSIQQTIKIKASQDQVYDSQFALQRCLSRLHQMQSKEYLEASKQ